MIQNVYVIKVNDRIVYVGRTNNVHTRQLQHRRDYRKGKKKLLYDYLRTLNYPEKQIILIVVRQFENITESKRYEAYLILNDHFTKQQLYQHVPNIRDR